MRDRTLVYSNSNHHENKILAFNSEVKNKMNKILKKISSKANNKRSRKKLRNNKILMRENNKNQRGSLL